jgi:hypothetical protein
MYLVIIIQIMNHVTIIKIQRNHFIFMTKKKSSHLKAVLIYKSM